MLVLSLLFLFYITWEPQPMRGSAHVQGVLWNTVLQVRGSHCTPELSMAVTLEREMSAQGCALSESGAGAHEVSPPQGLIQ